jgi:phage terminase small subunit
MPALKNPRREAFAQALARAMSASAAYVGAGYKANRHNAAALAREEHISAASISKPRRKRLRGPGGRFQ